MPEAPPEYTVYRSRPKLFGADEPLSGGPDGGDRRRPGRFGRLRRGFTWKRALGYLILAVLAWLALSLVVFLISAQVHQKSVDAGLGQAGFPLTSPNNILVLGSDQRPKGSKEPGADPGGPSRSDSILLLRAGGGKSARLSIPRDTVVDIPGHGTNKINAAYAIGGPELTVKTVEQFLGIRIDHVILVNFSNFPGLIDALGGIDYTGSCVISRINGGYSNGGYTLRLPPGTSHLDGKQALALARTRHNDCNPAETDLTREHRQQKILTAMKDRIVSPGAFVRLPWIAWEAPKAVRTDMGGFSLLGLFGALETGGTDNSHVLKPDGALTLPDGGAGLTVSDASKQAAVQRFLEG